MSAAELKSFLNGNSSCRTVESRSRFIILEAMFEATETTEKRLGKFKVILFDATIKHNIIKKLFPR